MPDPNADKPSADQNEPGQATAAENITEARNLLHSLRAELEQHPKLEEAILKLELALDQLTLASGGML